MNRITWMLLFLSSYFELLLQVSNAEAREAETRASNDHRVETTCSQTYWTQFDISSGTLIDKLSVALGSTLPDYTFKPGNNCNLRSPVENHGDTLFTQQIVLRGVDAQSMLVTLDSLYIPIGVEVYIYSPENNLLDSPLTSTSNSTLAWPTFGFPEYHVGTIIFQIQASSIDLLEETIICVSDVSCRLQSASRSVGDYYPWHCAPYEELPFAFSTVLLG